MARHTVLAGFCYVCAVGASILVLVVTLSPEMDLPTRLLIGWGNFSSPASLFAYLSDFSLCVSRFDHIVTGNGFIDRRLL